MPRRATTAALQVVTASAGATSDRELLARFVGGDESAFAAVVRRHGAMVQGVCRRVLVHLQDAEDATQAVFLILAKKAKTARWQHSIANWLYGTARRVALKLHRSNTRRQKREAKAVPPTAPASALDGMTGREAFAVLDDELDRLPAIYREPLVLCCLQGLARDEAAERLGVLPVTLKSHLDRGRRRLAVALEKRGVVAGAAVLAAFVVAPANACPPALIASVLVAVGGHPSPVVAVLAQGVAVNTWMKPTLLGVVLVAAVSFGLVGVNPPPAASADEKPAVKAEKPGAKKDAKPEKPTSVGGTVTGPDGKPVNGASVFIGYYRSGGMWAPGQERTVGTKVATTGMDGKFTGDVPKDAPTYFWVYATKPGLGAAWVEPEYPSPTFTDAAKLVLKMPADHTIRGKVLNVEGKAVAGVTVTVFTMMDPAGRDFEKFMKAAANGGFGSAGQWDNPLHPPVELFGTTTDADGKFEMAGVGADRIVGVVVSGKGVARMSGLVLTRAGVDVEPLNKQPGGSTIKGKGRHPVFYCPTPTLVVEPGYAVEGTVTDKKTGKPIPGCSLDINTGHWDRLSTVSDKDGKYRFDGMTKGMGHYIHVSPPKGVDVFPTWADVPEGTGFQPVTFDFAMVTGAVFTGKVIDKETREPVPAAFQIIPTADNDYAKKPEYETASRDMTWKGGDSSFRIVTLPGKSKVNIQVSPTETLNGQPLNRYATGQTLDIDLKETGNAEFTVEVERGKAVTLTAAADDGKPLSGVLTAGQTLRDHGFVTEHEVHTLPKGENKFTVYGLTAKEVRVVLALHPEKKLAGARLVTATSEGQLTLRPLQPIRGTFTDADGTPLAGATVGIVCNMNGLISLFREHAPKWQVSAVTDKDGKFEIPDAISGVPFTFDIRKGGVSYRGTPRLGAQTVRDGKPLDLGVRKLEEAQE